MPALADQALVAARRYSTIAPDAPHALHMPSHTFTRLGYWQESIDSNMAAAASARRAGQTAEELHASDYEIYAYLQTAQDQAADRIAKSMSEVASRFDPKVVISGAAGAAAGYFALAAIPARYALEREDWQQAERLVPRRDAIPLHGSHHLVCPRTGRGAPWTRAGGRARPQIRLRQIQEQTLHRANETYWARQVEIQQVAVSAWAAVRRRPSGRKP